MRHHLILRLVILYLLLLIALLTITSTFGMNRLLQHKIANEEARLYQEATLIANDYVAHMDNSFSDISAISNHFDSIHTYLGIRIWLVNRNGDVLTDTSQNGNAIHQNILTYNSQYLDEQLHIDNTLTPLLGEQAITLVYPITTQMQVKGYVLLHSSIAAIESEVMDTINTLNICILMFFICVALAFFLIGKMAIHPLSTLTKAAKEYADGNFSYTFSLKSDNEYKQLADTFLFMAGELTRQEEYQKHFIANISHDFRSPLTSIKGYAEALADGTIDYEHQGKYLDIIIFETERLSKLTSNLLDLSQFENNGVLLDISVFDINFVIKKTSETFEHACLEKGLHINLVFSEPKLSVEADLSKIQQVLYNLIDNAIKFSHHDAVIDITTEENNGKIFVSIKDYGVGIPKAQQKRIWERFYKSDSSRGRDKKGTGLGLSIVKEIVLAHNENINVISTEGVGTEFLFSLKSPD